MLQKKTSFCSWGLGLSRQQASLLQQFLGDEHSITFFEPGQELPLQPDTEPPCVLWLSSAYCRELCGASPEKRRHIELSPKVLLLEEGYSLQDFEAACDLGITEIIRPPLTRERMADAMRRILETQALNYDVNCMAREIMLERELLERKNELLSFLVNFLTNTTESLDIEYIMQTAFTGLGALLPVRGLHAVLWEQDSRNSPALSLYISASEKSPAYRSWRQALLDQTRLVSGREFSVQEITRLELPGQEAQWIDSAPEDGNLLCLPIITGNEQLGVLLLLTSMERHLGRDQALALDSAMRHFALSIKNARRFREMQMYADYDTLTRVHSRRHFENKLEEEMQRFTRYGQTMSLIMLDIDHFKKINDSQGHHVGDLVLREVAALISESIRSTDYCARYGGEEFVIILSHTSGDNAMLLAERMRKKIAAHAFLGDREEPLRLTVSMGISNLTTGIDKNRQALICEADAALYNAKQQGRNRTCDTPAVFVEERACCIG